MSAISKYIAVFIIVLFLCKCHDFKHDKLNPNINESLPVLSSDSIRSLLKSAIDSGNEANYASLSANYQLFNQAESFFYYSLLMANKHNNTHACRDVFWALVCTKGGRVEKQFDNLDSNTQKIALFYLLKAYELGDTANTKYDLIKILGSKNKFPKSSEIIRDLN